MCQPVSGPEVVLEERWAWKVFSNSKLKAWLYSSRGGNWSTGRPYKRGRWYRSTGVRSRWNFLGEEKTVGGFHVFQFKKDAECYGRNYEGHIEKVHIRGQALPFEGDCGPGWAVHEMMIPRKEEAPKRVRKAK